LFAKSTIPKTRTIVQLEMPVSFGNTAPETEVVIRMATECADELMPAHPAPRPASKSQVEVMMEVVPSAKAGIVTVRGEVDSASARALAEALHTASKWFNHVVVDLSNVQFFSATGVNALLKADRATVGLVCSPAVVRVIALCGLEGHWQLHKSVFLALASCVSTEGHLDARLAVAGRA
jgi:anti-anti-sigma factor